jgi:hypothetical protein
MLVSRCSHWMFLTLIIASLAAPATTLAGSWRYPKPWQPPSPASSDSVPAEFVAVATPDAVTATEVPTVAVSATAVQTPVTIAASSGGANPNAGIFAKGKRQAYGTMGWVYSFGRNYLLMGVGLSYYLTNGLSAGLDFEGWVMNSPQAYKLTPRIDYVGWRVPRIKPYGGAFYRRSWITDNVPDLNSLGGRAGVYYRGSGRGMAGAGMVYERYLDCDDQIYHSCNVVYPEFFASVSF